MKKIVALLLLVSLLLSSSLISFADGDQEIIIKPLVILMDYQDYTHEELAEKEEYSHVTGDSYESYEKDLYEEIFFNEGTYTGPDGNEYVSFRQYFKTISGSAYDPQGDVFGWYMASENAAYYGADNNGNGSDQDEAALLVKEALSHVSNEEGIDLSIYDNNDPKDLDGDGNYYEPDGEIDVVIVIHAGRGEEWWGHDLGEDAIWPFRIGFDWFEDGEIETITYGDNKSIQSNDFLVFEQDFPLALACHEFSHYLGLPDLYNNSGTSPVHSWSNMCGSYSGAIPGSLPPMIGAYGREMLSESILSDAVDTTLIDIETLAEAGLDITLSAAANPDNENTNLVRIDLPIKETIIVTPTDGEHVYFSQSGNYVTNQMTTALDLTSGEKAELSFKTWYDIDPEWDYASIQVKAEGTDTWVSVEGNITTTENPNDDTPEDTTDRNPGHGITLDTAGQWVDATFDLSEYAGKKIDLRFYFWTDGNTPEIGMYVDEIKVTLDDEIILEDNAEGESAFTLEGFKTDTGKLIADHYYLLEYRDHQGLDEALELTYYWHEKSIFNEGLVIWYIDEAYTEDGEINQENGTHPGRLSVGIVDAGQVPVHYRPIDEDSFVDRVSYQMHDAAFSLQKEPEYMLEWGKGDSYDDSIVMQPVFSDGYDYSSTEIPEAGLILENLGLNIFVTKEDTINRTMDIHIQNDKSTFASEYMPSELSITDNILTVSIESDDLSDTAYAVYTGESKTLDNAFVELTLIDGLYTGNINEENAEYNLSSIVVEDINGSFYGIYNSQEYNGFGVDFDSLQKKVETTEYVIQANDFLWKIARKFKTTIESIATLNSIDDSNKIIAGQTILVPSN